MSAAIRSGKEKVSLTHGARSDVKLALSVYQAVLDDGKESRISVRGSDPNYGGSQVHVLKYRHLK